MRAILSAWQTRHAWPLAVLTGLLLLFSFPRFDLDFLAWVALAPLTLAAAAGGGLRRAFGLGWVAGLVFTFLAENWIAHSMTRYGGLLTGVAYGVALLFAAVLAIFPALFALSLRLLVRAYGWPAIALAPLLWVATEWLRPLVTGVTWNALGVSQAGHFGVARLAQWGGVYLVSWELAAASAFVVLLFKARERAVRLAAAAVAVSGLAPLLLPEPARLPSAAVSAVGVQPNLSLGGPGTPEEFARDLEQNFALSREAIRGAPGGRADMVVWAESPLGLFYENDPAVRARLEQFAAETGSYLVLNTVTREGGRYFNSVHVVSPRTGEAARLRRYDKVRLVPFGEYVPWRGLLGRFVPAIVGEFTPGREAVVHLLRLETARAALLAGDERAAGIERTTDFVRVGAFICYEAAYPNLVREFVRRGATLLVNVSNDAWFGDTAGARQHLAHARMRAIENHRDLVRATNTGVTALVTADGRVLDPLPMFAPGARAWAAEARRGLTFYTRHGDAFALVVAAAAALSLLLGVLRCIRVTPKL